MSGEKQTVTPLDVQVGGDHYKKLAIQPIEYTMLNHLDFVQGSVIKYVTRYKDKNGVEDLRKARHLLDIQIAALAAVEAVNE